jgi:hypothetical protein
MSSSRLSLIQLIAPQYLAGIQLPSELQSYLDIVGIDHLDTFYTDREVVYTGKASLGVNDRGSATQVNSNNGSSFSWDTPYIHFRMFVPRNGAEFIEAAANDFDESDPDSAGHLPKVSQLLNDLLPSPDQDMDTTGVVTDFPAVGFRIELLVDVLNFTLGEEWKAGRIDPIDNRVRIDTTITQADQQRVKIRLPKVVLSYSQGDLASDLSPQFSIDSWGVAGFDSPQDLGMGELIRMEPSIAVYQNELIGFSLDRVTLDLSEAATPPEILAHFGVDEAWKGLYVGQALFFFNNDQGVGFNFRVKDLLISFAGEVTMEAALDIYLNSTIGILTAEPIFYQGERRVTEFRRGVIFPSVATRPSGTPEGLIALQKNAVMHLQISGGMPTYHTQVLKSDGTDIWDPATRSISFDEVGTQDLFILVTDSSTGVGSPLRSSEFIRVVVTEASEDIPRDGLPGDRPEEPTPLQPLAPFAITGNTEERFIALRESEGNVLVEVSGQGNFTVNVSGTRGTETINQSYANQRVVTVPAPNSTQLNVAVAFDPIPGGEAQSSRILFSYDRPNASEVARYIDYALNNTPLSPADPIFSSSIRQFLTNGIPTGSLNSIDLVGSASRDSINWEYDQQLAGRRNSVIRAILQPRFPGVAFTEDNLGHGPNLPFSPSSNPQNRSVLATFNPQDIAGETRSATISRPAAPSTPPPTPPSPPQLPAPPEEPNAIPHVLRQLGIRIKLDRNDLSLLELYGKIDLETELEAKLREESPDVSDGRFREEDSNPEDGVVDFKLSYQYDKATNETALAFLLKSDERDKDGIIPPLKNSVGGENRLLNILGALLLFAPIINSAAKAVGDNNEDGTAWVGLGASLAVPIAIGGLNVFRTRKIILHGGEARTRWVTPAPGEPLRSLDLGLIFDYEVQFDIICQELGIGLDRLNATEDSGPKPLRARYKAIGFNVNYSDTPGYKGLTYTPIFDASKGYDLDLSDPSLFALPAPLGDLFQIAGARLARFNPVTLEIDFAIKVDLGIITVDKFKLKIPLDPTGAPQIIPSGVKINIPGVIVGNGFVEIVDTKIAQPDGTEIEAKGIEGGLDITLVSLKIRVAANLGIGTISDPVSKREAVSVFLGLRVEFPTPIILGATGLGIYGFMGLFAMHYRRLEPNPDPTKAVGPALNWLIKASGDPTRLRTESAAETAMAPSGPKLWEMAFDRWSFGLGVLMGTAEGGFLVNMQGMFVLELPGPRILIMVKVKMVSVLPSNPADPAKNLEMGIIGVVDIDFGRKQLTLGVMINFSIEEVLAVALPIELFFKWDNPSHWHLYLGTIAQPASATILDIVRGSAYVMIQGNKLTYADYGSKVPAFFRDKVLQGIAIAIGLEAAIVLGDEAAGIYLKIAAGAHLGVSFSPFLVVGNMYFEGHLRLLIVSLSAKGSFDIMVSKRPNADQLKTFIQGEVCGSIDLWFFEIKACVGLSIGTEDYDVEPPKLIRGVYLQSFSPVLVSGQGSQKPIDASLGTAQELSGGTTGELTRVPIDTLPIIQLHASPKIGAEFNSNSFISNPGTLSGTGGKIKLSDEVEVEYILESVRLLENGSPYISPTGNKPPSVWRIDRPNNSSPTDTAIDLATFSRTPATAPYAVERSSELDKLVEVRWENACKTAAPPASVFHTFCDQALGYSSSGWTLYGTPKPDPEGTLRLEPVQNKLIITPDGTNGNAPGDWLLGSLGLSHGHPAQIVGISALTIPPTQTKERKCIKTLIPSKSANQLTHTFENEVKATIHNPDSKGTVTNPGKTVDPNIKLNKDIKIVGEIKPLPGKVISNPPITPTPSIKPIPGLGDNIKDLIQTVPVGIPLTTAVKLEFLQDKPHQVQLRIEVEAGALRKDRMLRIQAISKTGQMLVQEIHTPRQTNAYVETVTLNSEGIHTVVLSPSQFSGRLVEVCFERTKVTLPEKPTYPTPCLRALEMPWFRPTDYKQRDTYNRLLDNQLQDLEEKMNQESGLIFETGSCKEIWLYGALHLKFASELLVEELDHHNKVLASHQLSDLIVKTVNNPAADLPADWLNPQLPWRSKTLMVATYISLSMYSSYRKFLAVLNPKYEEMCKFRIVIKGRPTGFPALYLSALELLQQSEVAHHTNVQIRQATEQTTLTGYLSDDTPVPLLRPNKQYQLDVSYTSIVRTRKKVSDPFEVKKTQSHTQSFAFATDQEAPLPLSPYVLGTTPAMDERFHFFQDELKVVFNDKSFLAMYQSYGKQLRAVIRGADGKPVFNSPEVLSTLEEIPAAISSPYWEALQKQIQAGKLPCTGTVKVQNHAVFSPNFELKPMTPYTFDIELDPPISEAADGTLPLLFRRSFITSRYPNLAGMAEAIRASTINHRALKQIPSGLPSANPVTPEVLLIPDIELEQLLESGGLKAGNPKDHNAFTLLWNLAGANGDFVPYALLIDAIEPLWRNTMLVGSNKVKNEKGDIIDENFIIYEPREVPSMVLEGESAQDHIRYFVRNESGTRTLVIFRNKNWPKAGSEFSLHVKQLGISFFEIEEKSAPLISLKIYPDAPWEDS